MKFPSIDSNSRALITHVENFFYDDAADDTYHSVLETTSWKLFFISEIIGKDHLNGKSRTDFVSRRPLFII